MDVMVGSKAAFNLFQMRFWAWRSEVVAMEIEFRMFTMCTSPVAIACSIPWKHRCVEKLSNWHNLNLVCFFWIIVLPNPWFNFPIFPILSWVWNCSAREPQTYQMYSKHKHTARAGWLSSTGSETKQNVSCWIMLVEPCPFYATHGNSVRIYPCDIFCPFLSPPQWRQGFPISLHHHNLAPRCMCGGSRDAPMPAPDNEGIGCVRHKDSARGPKRNRHPMLNDV